MQIKQITQKTEELAIAVTKSCQVIAIYREDGFDSDFINEEIEISLVDFTSGKEEILIRKNKIRTIAEIAAQGGNYRPNKTALIEIADGGKLYLDANRIIRINLTNLVVDRKYIVNSIETEEMTNTAIVYEQLIVSNGVNNQKFPLTSGNILMLPKTGLVDVRAVYSDGTEVRCTKKELELRAEAVNGMIGWDTASSTPVIGSDKILLYDLICEKKRVVEFEINLDTQEGYTMLKLNNLNKPGFDNRF